MRQYKNPVILYNENEYGRTADPYVLRCNDMYYHCYMKRCGEEGGVYITEAKELCDIGCGKEVRVYKDIDGAREWYAPELHRIGDTWYIYGAPDVNGKGLHSMCVLELKGDCPIGEYTNRGLMKGLENIWAIDGTPFEHYGKRYFSWSDCGRIYIAEMENPYGIKGEVLSLPKAEYEFEQRKGKVIEGPAILKRGNKIHIVYSCNNSQSDEYCLGIMTYENGDILDAKNWEKSKNAVFEKTEEIFGPGHCSFTTVTENGVEEDYIVYHANLESGSGWFGRNVWIQKFIWDDNDMPIFGKPSRDMI